MYLVLCSKRFLYFKVVVNSICFAHYISTYSLGGDYLRDEEVLALGAALCPIGRIAFRAGFGSSPGEAGREFLINLAKKTGRKEYELVAPFQLLLDGWEAFEGEVADEKILEMGKAIHRAISINGPCDEDDITRPLISVFTLVDIGNGTPKTLYYKPGELDLERELPIPTEDVKLTQEDYAEILGRVEYDLSQNYFVPDVSRVLAVLERHLTFVPACTDEPTVSFYDYARLLSAVALALFFAEDRGKPFLIVRGDLSGIQSFVFRITSKGALKMLRARSVYLDLLSWDVVLEILNRSVRRGNEFIRLPRSCVLYNGGGVFTLILPNGPGIRKNLEKIRASLEKFLLRNFDGQLYVALAWVEVDEGNFRTFEDGRLWARLKDETVKRKAKRFLGIMEDSQFVDTSGFYKLHECAVCRKQISDDVAKRFSVSDPQTGETLNMCELCYEMWHLGMALPKVRLFARVSNAVVNDYGIDSKKSVTMPFSRIYWFRDFEELIGLPYGSEILLKNSFTLWEVPSDYVAVPYVVADYAKLTEKDGRTVVMSLEELAENSVGAKKIAVFKADVDNLGFIFSRGLPDTRPVLSAGLSRLMDYFFKAYLNSIIKDEIEGEWYRRVLSESPRLPVREFGTEAHPGLPETRANIVVVYAGGDDLFIVGAWNEVFNLAFKVRNVFRVYSGNNPNITMSGGYATFAPDFPISRIADVGEERLETAKDEGKDRIALIDREVPWGTAYPFSYQWDLYMKLWKKYGSYFKFTRKGLVANGNTVPKSQLWKILEIRQAYVLFPKSISWNYLLAYYLSRYGLEGVFGDMIKIEIEKFLNGEPQEIYWIDGILKPILFASRG